MKLNLKKYLKNTTISLPNPNTKQLEPYLTRYYLFGKDMKYFNIFIHEFHNSDLEEDLHNHPFKYSLSFILSGGYKEYLYKNGKASYKIRKPFSFNFLNNKIFHKVELLEKKSWSIFFAGPRFSDWGFLNPTTKTFKHWSSSKNAIP